MPETERDDEIGDGKPPASRRFNRRKCKGNRVADSVPTPPNSARDGIRSVMCSAHSLGRNFARPQFCAVP
jgi:hypothetical protein